MRKLVGDGTGAASLLIAIELPAIVSAERTRPRRNVIEGERAFQKKLDFRGKPAGIALAMWLA
jgi:hypothetical protein